MATAVNITLTMDNSGVVTVANQTGDVLRKIAPPSQKIRQEFDGIESAERRAHIAGQLFARTTGVEMPRALETVISRSRIMGPLLAGAFNASIIAAAAGPIFEIVKGLGEAIANAGGYTEQVRKVREETIAASREAFISPKTLQLTQDHLNQVNKQVEILTKASKLETSRADSIRMEGTLEGKLTAFFLNGLVNHQASVDLQTKANALTGDQNSLIQHGIELHAQFNKEAEAAEAKAAQAGLQGFALIKQQFKAQQMEITNATVGDALTRDALLKAAQIQFHGQMLALERESTTQTIALRHQVAEESVQGIARIQMQEIDAIEDVDRKRAQSLITDANAEEQRVLIHKRAADQIRQAENEMLKGHSEAQLFAEQRANAFLTGSQKIIAEAQYEKDVINAALNDVIHQYGLKSPKTFEAWLDAQTKILAITKATDQQILIQQQQLRDKTIDLQQQAAIGALPEWARAEATIRLEHDKTYQELNKLELTDLSNFAQYEQQKAAADLLMNDHLRDAHKQLTEQLGSDLQSVFDDITSGNIGKRILANMEKLFFQILAQWILSLNLMKSAAGSIFGSIVFGPGSTGAGVFGGGGQGGGSSLLGGILGGLFGGSSSESAKIGMGGGITSSSAIPGLVGATPSGLGGAIAGTGATASSALIPSASSALTSATMSEALPGLVGGTTAQLGSSGTKTSSFAAGSPLAGLATLAPGLIGNFGGKMGQIGGLVSMLAILGNSQILSAISGGLIGFGVGESHGGFLGALSGAGSGALTGFLAAGPIGALIGGIAGLLGGIFGGIFGGNKRKKQANALFDNTISPDITQIITGFDGFQVDSNSAIQQLEQLRTDAQKQLSALKSQGKDVFNQKVGPAIDSAEKHIRDTQAERDRRGAMLFGPPQFATGGMFSTMGGNAGLAVLHDGEFVVNSQATKKNAAALKSINAGGSAGGQHIEVHIHPDTFDRAYVRSRKFEDDIAAAVTRMSVEGRW